MKQFLTAVLILLACQVLGPQAVQQPEWLHYYARVMPVRNSFPVSTVTSGASTVVRFKTVAKVKTGGLR